ncbi:MAG: hypothetical protein K6E83_03655, partial [Clostridium sp.]|nr:hypothetical protein [Clostridium sp.]
MIFTVLLYYDGWFFGNENSAFHLFDFSDVRFSAADLFDIRFSAADLFYIRFSAAVPLKEYLEYLERYCRITAG